MVYSETTYVTYLAYRLLITCYRPVDQFPNEEIATATGNDNAHTTETNCHFHDAEKHLVETNIITLKSTQQHRSDSSQSYIQM